MFSKIHFIQIKKSLNTTTSVGKLIRSRRAQCTFVLFVLLASAHQLLHYSNYAERGGPSELTIERRVTIERRETQSDVPTRLDVLKPIQFDVQSNGFKPIQFDVQSNGFKPIQSDVQFNGFKPIQSDGLKPIQTNGLKPTQPENLAPSQCTNNTRYNIEEFITEQKSCFCGQLFINSNTLVFLKSNFEAGQQATVIQSWRRVNGTRRGNVQEYCGFRVVDGFWSTRSVRSPDPWVNSPSGYRTVGSDQFVCKCFINKHLTPKSFAETTDKFETSS